jgi:flagellar hook-associated protein 3 FlgL
MRVSNRGYTERIKASLNRPSARLGDLYTQLTSGKRVLTPADDPLAATRIVRANNNLRELSARRFVIGEGQRLLGGADTALGQAATALQSCQQLGLRAQSPSLETDERAAIAQEIRGLREALLDAGNSRVDDKYLFSGSRTDTVPFTETSGGNLPVAYNGNHQARAFSLTPSETATAGFTGAEVFNFADATGQRPVSGADRDVFSLLDDLAASLESEDMNEAARLTTMVTACHDQVISLRGQAGVMTRRYETAGTACDWSEARLKELLAEDQDLDMAAALVDLSTEQTAYEAIMGMTSQLLQLPNLFASS